MLIVQNIKFAQHEWVVEFEFLQIEFAVIVNRAKLSIYYRHHEHNKSKKQCWRKSLKKLFSRDLSVVTDISLINIKSEQPENTANHTLMFI